MSLNTSNSKKLQPVNKQCHTCTWWAFVFDDDNKQFGLCSNETVVDRLRVTPAVEVVKADDNVIYTESCFGCVYHQTDNNSVTQIEMDL